MPPNGACMAVVATDASLTIPVASTVTVISTVQG
jgi:hypothetical protein